MKRQPYFPRTVAERPGWFENYSLQLPMANATLGLPAADVTNSQNDAGFCQYATGIWLTAVREFGPASTAALDDLFGGTGGGTFALPTFTAPPLPPTVGMVAPGALDRIFAFVQTIKANPNYTDAIGLQLRIIGAEDSSLAGTNAPTFTLKTERLGAAQESVRISFKKAGHQGVVIYSQRGGGTWEMLGIDLASPYLDERPLLNPAQPELRSYRLQFYDNDTSAGDFSDVSTVTVSP